MKRYRFKKKRNIILISLIDFIGNIFFGPFIKKTLPEEFRNILIIRLDHIGDVLLTTPSIKALRDCFPKANISILVGSWAKGVVEGNPNINEIIIYDAPWFKRDKGKAFGKDIIAFFRIIKGLQRRAFDLVIEFRGDIRNILLAYLSKGLYRIGYDIGGGGFLLSKVVSYPFNLHEVERNLEIVQSIKSVKIKESELELYIKEEDFIKGFLDEQGINHEDFIIGIHPGTGCPARLWREDRFAKLADELIRRYKAKIVFNWGAREKDLINRIASIMEEKPIISPPTTIGQLSALIRKYSLFICVDSAPMHIAVAMKTPTITLFSGTNDPRQWGPYGKGHVVIQKDVECKGCELKECKDHKCMDLITVEDVLKVVETMIKGWKE